MSAASAAAGRPVPGPSGHPRATIAVACVAVTMLMLDISVINTALSDIAAGLRTDLTGLQWVIDAYTLPLAATVLTVGALADRLGRRRVFLVGLVLFAVASAACATAGSIGALVAARAVQGLGAAILFATALALIAQVAPTAEQRAKALAVFGAAIGGAFAIGPFVGGGLTELLGWRSIFWINVPIGVAGLLVALRRVGESRDEQARPVDWPGQVALVGGMFLLVLGLLRGNEDGWSSGGSVATMTGAVLLLALFAVIQARSTRPMLPLGLFRDRAFVGAQVAVAGISSSFFALFLYLTLYLQSVLGLSPLQTGLVYLPGTLAMFIVSGLTANAGPRFPPARLATIGLALVAVGLAALLVADEHSSWTAVMPGVVITCVGTGLFNPASGALALNALPEHQSGLASGANDLFRQAGIAVGIAALGTLVPAADALGGEPARYVDGLHDAVVAASAIAALAALAVWALLRPRRSRTPEEVQSIRVTTTTAS